MDCDCDRETQIVALAGLTAELDRRGIQVELVADEWCNTLEDIREFADRRAGHMVQIKTPDLGGINNTIEAVLYCKAHGIGAYQGGTCNETDRSAQVCVHCAMATQPVQILANQQFKEIVEKSPHAVFHQTLFFHNMPDIRLNHLAVIHQHHPFLRYKIAAAETSAVPADKRQSQRSTQAAGAGLGFADMGISATGRMAQHIVKPWQRRFMYQLL